MRYLANDGEVFDTVQECKAHEDQVLILDALKQEAEAYADNIDWSDNTGRARSRLVNQVYQWLVWDLKKNPGRYQVIPEPPVVQAISGVKDA